MSQDYDALLEAAAADDFSDFKAQCFLLVTGCDNDHNPVVVLSAPDLNGHKNQMDRVKLFVLLTLDSIANHEFVLVYFDAASAQDSPLDLEWLQQVLALLPEKYSTNISRIYLMKLLLKHRLWLASSLFTGGANLLLRKVQFEDELEEVYKSVQPSQLYVPPNAANGFACVAEPYKAPPGKSHLSSILATDEEQKCERRGMGPAGGSRARSSLSDSARIKYEPKHDAKVFGVELKSLIHRSDTDERVPTIVMDCIMLIEEALVEGVRLRGLFTTYSEEVTQSVLSLASAYDSGEEVDLTTKGCDAVTGSMLLLTYFRCLPEPLVPSGDILQCLFGSQGIDDFDMKVACISPLLMSLPTAHLNLLQEILTFLNCIHLLDQEKPGIHGALDVHKLAEIFTPIIIGPGMETTMSPLSLVVTLIEGCNDIFASAE